MAALDLISLGVAVGAGLLALLLAQLTWRGLRRGVFRARLATALGTRRPRRSRIDALAGLTLLGGRVEPLLGARVCAALRVQVQRAGEPGGLSARQWLGLRALSGALGAVLAGLLLLGGGGTLGSLGAALLAGLGLVGIDVGLQGRAVARRAAVERGLPVLVDLLALCLGAGMNFESALATVSSHLSGPLAHDVKRYLVAVNELGDSRASALHALAARTGSPAVQQFAIAIVEAAESGAGLLTTIEAQAQMRRSERRRDAQASAKRAPIRMLFPLTIFILPVLMLVVLGPTALRVVDALQATHQ